jgi:hypothetical protein
MMWDEAASGKPLESEDLGEDELILDEDGPHNTAQRQEEPDRNATPGISREELEETILLEINLIRRFDRCVGDGVIGRDRCALEHYCVHS